MNTRPSPRLTRRAALGALITVLGAASACSDEAQLECSYSLAGGRCVGVPQGGLCEGAFCTSGVSCTRTYHVRAGAGAGGDGSAGAPLSRLADAASQAVSGDCIALAAGSYSPATLAGGVSLLGAGADSVTISVGAATGASPLPPALTVKGGSGGVLRGFTISGEGRGLFVSKTANLRLEQLRVTRTREIGIEVSGATGLSIRNVEIDAIARGPAGADGAGLVVVAGADVSVDLSAMVGAASQGVLVSESRVALRDTLVQQCGEHGVAVMCSTDPRCQTSLASSLTDVTLLRNKGSSLLLFGARVSGARVEIDSPRFMGARRIARGIEAQAHNNQQAHLELDSSTIRDSAGEGAVLDRTTGKLANTTIRDSGDRGVWVQGLDSGALLLKNNQVLDNSWAGIGATGASGLTIEGGTISGTRKKTLPAGNGGTITCGDGVQVLGSSRVTVQTTTVQNNARAAVLVDASEARVSGSTIAGGASALVVQNTSIDASAYKNNTDGSGKAVAPAKPPTPLPQDPTELIGHMPIPLP